MTSVANRLVSYLLRSPLHRMLSGSTCLIRYNGRRTGRQITTPTQYAQHGDQLVMLVGRHADKTWWRNFSVGGDIEVLLRRQWKPMTARAVVGADEPDIFAPLLDAYLRRFPKVLARLRAEGNDSTARSVVLVWCRSRARLLAIDPETTTGDHPDYQSPNRDLDVASESP